jgi:hypothetical protein
MSSTRNINTKNDYCIQQRIFQDAETYKSYANSSSGKAYKNNLVDLGINPSHMPSEVLSNNAIDIESQLYGIHSTSLVGNSFKTTPELKHLDNISFFNKVPFYRENKLYVKTNERPFPVSKS